MGQCGVDAGPVLADGAGEFDERGESTAPGPLQPGVEQRDPFGALELKHLPKLLLEQVRAIERRVGLGDPGEGAGLTFGEIAGVLPQREAGVLQLLRHRLLPALAGRVPHLTPDLVERLGRPGHDMKRVQAQLGVLATSGDDGRDPLGRIGADQRDLGAALHTEGVEELLQRRAVPARTGPQQHSGIVINDHREVLVAALASCCAPTPALSRSRSAIFFISCRTDSKQVICKRVDNFTH